LVFAPIFFLYFVVLSFVIIADYKFSSEKAFSILELRKNSALLNLF